MPALLPHIDPDGLLEFSVVYTDRALNHMSQRFQRVMVDISALLKQVYHGHATALVPGSGSFGMEAVARQFAGGRRVMVLRNGWFSYRWSQIFEMGAIPAQETVLKARPLSAASDAPWQPCPLDEVLHAIARERPEVVFAPHVETAAGLLLPDAYLRAVGEAVRAVGGLFVLDCVASGALWVDMQACAVDVLISAPQKGWSGSPACAMIVLGERACAAIEPTRSSSFACDLKKWLQVMQAYEAGSHTYHTTMPTDALVRLREVMLETQAFGFEHARAQQNLLGRSVRELFAARGLRSVAAPGFEAPGVVVSHTRDPLLQNGSKLRAVGLQSAAGVPLMCDEGPDWCTFRIGLFGLDKLQQPERSVAQLRAALDAIGI